MTKLSIDTDELTIGDLEDFHTLAGMSLEAAFAERLVLDADGNKIFDEKGRPLKAATVNPTALKALIYINQRRDNPDFTIDDARNVKISELEIGRAEADPQ